MKAMDNPAEKDGNLYHVEDVIDKPESNALKLTRTDFFEAQNDSLSEGRSPWPVIKENLKLCMVVLAVQVRRIKPLIPNIINLYIYLQTNGIILGLEYTFLGALVGVQAFCRTMGSYDESSGSYAVAASTLSLWAGLFGLMYVDRCQKILIFFAVHLTKNLGSSPGSSLPVGLQIVTVDPSVFT